MPTHYVMKEMPDLQGSVKKRTVTPPIAMRRASLWGKLIFRRKRNWCIKPIGTVRCGVHRGSLSALRKNILPDNGWR